jgi:predicted RND superfamily exporter protein
MAKRRRPSALRSPAAGGGCPARRGGRRRRKARIRAIILTSITTILGLAPLLTETSLQARFLIPMGISISFGLAFATLLTLVLVPALYVIVHDVRRGLAATRHLFPTIVPPREDGQAKL